jgi:hypothetical protein
VPKCAILLRGLAALDRHKTSSKAANHAVYQDSVSDMDCQKKPAPRNRKVDCCSIRHMTHSVTFWSFILPKYMHCKKSWNNGNWPNCQELRLVFRCEMESSIVRLTKLVFMRFIISCTYKSCEPKDTPTMKRSRCLSAADISAVWKIFMRF